MKENTTNNIILVEEGYANQRLDNFLCARLSNISKSVVYKWVRTGQVRVNGGRIAPNYRLVAEDKVRLPPRALLALKSKSTGPHIRDSEWLKAHILYEDTNCLVINKPAGIAVHAGTGSSVGVIELVRHWGADYISCELVHRLDKPTSGCLLLAKKHSSLRFLHTQLRERTLKKTYHAVVAGRLKGCRTITKSLKKYHLPSGEHIVRVHPEGKEAHTVLNPVRRHPLGTLVQVHLTTGRTHQIRVHCQSIGHPIVGDTKYNMQVREDTRLFLHASELCFTISSEVSPLCVKAPLPSEFE